MKTIIYYKSNTGFTFEYVKLLKPRIECEKDYDIKKINKNDIIENDNIIFMGPIRNNVILGLNKFLKKYKYMINKNVFIFACGMEPVSSDKKDNIIMANALQDYHVRLYLLPGGFDLSRMKPFKRWIFKQGIKVASKSHPELAMVSGRTLNMVDGRNLDNMVEVYYKINRAI